MMFHFVIRSFLLCLHFCVYFYHLMTSLHVLAVHPLNVNILKFLIICCKGKILSSMKVKVHHLIHFLSIFTYPTSFNCIMFQRDRLLVSDSPATSNVGNPATRWIFEQCWMLESLEYISELRVHSRPLIRKQQGGPVFVALGGTL